MAVDPLILVAGGSGAILLIAIIAKLAQHKSPSTNAPRTQKVSRQVSKALAEGDYETAALRAVQSNDLESAYELYLRAQQPTKAAQIAHRLGRVVIAAELYEKGGDKGRAAALYREAGLGHRAAELEPLGKGTSLRPAQALDFDASPPGTAAQPMTVASPSERADQAEKAFRDAQRAAKPGDEAADLRVKKLAELASEAWLSAGDIKRAADVCRDADLVEQAVNLYANVLGDPAAAAGVVAVKGDHERAAQLYEAAGQKQRALAAWVSWAKGAQDPLDHLRDVERLGPEAPGELLGAVVRDRPLGPKTIELHYRIAIELADRKHGGDAIPVLERILALDPRFRDAEQRLSQLRASYVAPAPKLEEQAPPKRDPAAPTKRSADPRLPDADSELEQVVHAAAARAAEIVQRGDREQRARESREPAPPQVGTALSPGRSRADRRVEVDVIEYRHTADSAVKEAKSGPSASELRELVAGQTADLGNIEVFYRLGLALLAGGAWDDAKKAFEQVEEVSPGYRDAHHRISDIDKWSKVVAPTVFAAKSSAGGRYTVLGELGRGGMAVVYRARDEALGREVALKFLSEEASGNDMFMQFFQREARAAGSLNHPNIVTIYDVGTLDGKAFICMELVDGTSIDNVLETHGPMRLADALHVIEQVLVALEYAHGKKIIHRDIKPANMMRTASGVVKLMDFGLAKSVDGPKKSTVISGTPSYMAPEQLTGKEVDMRADLFAVGATLYELLSGAVPFHGLVRVDAPPPISVLLPDCPPALDVLLRRALEFTKEKRYASAKEMLEPIRWLLGLLNRGVPAKAAGGTVLGISPSAIIGGAPPSPPQGPPPQPQAQQRRAVVAPTVLGGQTSTPTERQADRRVAPTEIIAPKQGK